MRRQQILVNNLVVGCRTAIQAKNEDIVEANYSDSGKGAISLNHPVCFLAPEQTDYRLSSDSPANTNGVQNIQTRLIRHDFFGLLRFPSDTWTVGAFRSECALTRDADPLIEVEFRNGDMRRIDNVSHLSDK